MTAESPVVADPTEERALYESAAIVERADRRRWIVEGAKAAEVLNGLVSNEVQALVPGAGCYAAALTPKGKIVADLRIFAREGDFLVDANDRAADGWSAMLRKFVNPRLAKWRDVTDEIVDLGVFGPRAERCARDAVGEAPPLADLRAYAHVTVGTSGETTTIASTPELEVSGYDLFVPARVQHALRARLLATGAVEIGSATLEAARIASGRPSWGADMDDSTLTQEANLDALGAISYEKGCYVGQETVARLHFRGHVNRYLRRARFASGDSVPAKAELLDAQAKSVGDVRSSAISHRHGGVAIAMVRREVPAGATLTARWNGRDASLRLEPEES